MTDNLANKINDLRKLAEERKNNSSLLPLSENDRINELNMAATGDHSHSRSGASRSNQNKPFTPSKRQLTLGNLERPASRAEITALERELEERVRLVLDTKGIGEKTNEAEFSAEGFVFEPHRESMMVVRERMLSEFGIDSKSLYLEPWLDSFIKCECLRVMCDDISSKFADMLAVHSVELGSVLRKLRLTYKQSFEQMHASWKTLRHSYLDNTGMLQSATEQAKRLKVELQTKENELNVKFDNEIQRLNAEFNAEKARDEEKIRQTEFKMDQMSDTLKYLNGIFRTMQSDGATVKSADLQSKCYRLEKENFALQEQNASLEKVNAALAKAEARIKQLEKEQRQQHEEMFRMKHELDRREEVVKNLMEREAIRNAEIEKLQKISKMKDDELVAVDLKDSATSVLCIKCKKSLDDLSNIRSAILGDAHGAPGNRPNRMQCETFRILLPNLKGRQPNRNSKWLKSCMRSILLSKLKEDVNLQFIKGQRTRFPAYVYAWFVRIPENKNSGSHLTKLLAAADEDRWGLYYGVRALSKEDPEAMLFWSLLDETNGEDGLHFALYCLSVILSIGGTVVWKQFGTAVEQGASINVKPPEDKHTVDTIWLDLLTAKEATKMILVRALSAHVQDAMDAIDALRVRPSDLDLDAIADMMKEEIRKPAPEVDEIIEESDEQNGETSKKIKETTEPVVSVPLPESEPEENQKDPAIEASRQASALTTAVEPTHINLFMWLRLMMQQLHADQIQRAAAIRLMFETASVGALTPQTAFGTTTGGSNSDPTMGNATFGATGTHVEYPQFQSICTTLFPHVPISESAVLYANCFDIGQRRVNSEVFTRVADKAGYFAHALKLPLLPLLRQRNATQLASAGSISSDISAVVQHVQLGGDESASSAQIVEGYGQSVKATGYTLRTEQAVRSKLATMVHRKLAAVMPSLKNMLQSLPEKWHKLVEDAIDTVKLSLSDSLQKLQQQQNEQLSHSYSQVEGTDRVTMDETLSARSYIDGIQPFIHYRRLLLLASLVKTLCDNPLLPTDLFSAADLDNDSLNIDQAMFRADKLLTNIEHGFLLGPSGSGGKGNTFLGLMDKYHKFETVRMTLVARRLQNVFKKFLTRDLPVPRSVRLCMSPGYLGMTSFATAVVEQPVAKLVTRTASAAVVSASKQSNRPKRIENLYLRNREVYHEPWWGQALVAEVYRFKLTYDFRAASLGLPPIPLAQAVTSSQYYVWGTMELAETMVHDLFVCAKAYRQGVPRLRLFSAFLGDGRDLDDHVAQMLAMPHAVSVYLSLLIEIHKELISERKETLLHPPIQSQNPAKGLNTLTEGSNKQNKSETNNMSPNGISSSEGLQYETLILFPATENSFKRTDKREVWNCSAKLLSRVARRWALQQKCMGGSHNIYSELPEKLKLNAMEQVEVDDFLWIMMVQWAKLASWYVKRSSKNTNQIEKTYLSTRVENSKAKVASEKINQHIAAAVKSGAYGRHKILSTKANLQNLPLLPVSSLRAIVEATFPPGEGRHFVDPHHYIAEYVLRVGVRRNALKLSIANSAQSNPTGMFGKSGSKFTSEMENILQDCVLWDTNNIEVQYRSALDLFSKAYLDNDGSNDSSSLGATASDSSAGASALAVSTPPVISCMPELVYMFIKQLFQAYSPAIKTYFEELFVHLEQSIHAELEAKYQSANNQFLALSEILGTSAPEVEFHSWKLLVHDADCISLRVLDRDVRTTVEHMQQTLSPSEMENQLKQLKNSSTQCKDVMGMWHSLISTLVELSIATDTEVPHDPWNKGTKTHVDRAFVYSIVTKNSPDL